MYKRCKNLLVRFYQVPLIWLLIFLGSLKPAETEESWKWVQRCLLQSFNQFHGAPLKKWDLSVSPEGFFRLRKYFASGKQEYFAFRLSKIKTVNYSGNADSGDILFETFADDIIVQTYNDPKGNIDSMSTVLSLPVLKLDNETLDSLQIYVLRFKTAK